MNLQSLAPLLVLLLCACGADVEGTGAPATLPAEGATSSETSPGEAETGRGAAQNAPASPLAKMTFVTRTIDFGEVWDTEEMKGSFAFQNVGGKPLVISEVKPSCGCTSTELAKMRFAPGEKDTIELIWKPIGFGDQAKTITVKSNSAGPGIEVLTIRAKIKPFVTFLPQPLKFDIMRYGQVNTARVFMKCVDPDFELLELSSSQKHLSVESVGRQADGSYELELTFDDSTPWGQLNCTLKASVRGAVRPGDPKIEHVANLNVHASVFGDLQADPSLFLVGHVLPGRKFERRTKLTHAGGKPFKVVSTRVLNPKPPGIQVRTEPFNEAGEQGHFLIVSGDAGDYLGLIRAQVLVLTDIPGESERKLSVMGIVRQ